MFKRIVIQLTGPVCNCEGEDLAWTPETDEDGSFGLVVTCKKCGTKLSVSNKKFLATFQLDTPYPVQQTKEKKLTVLDGGKVIPFNKEEK